MAYSLVLLSPIPIIRRADAHLTLDLWARDLEVQLLHTSRLKLICPVATDQPRDWTAVAPLPTDIEIVSVHDLRGARIEAALEGCDVLQLPGNQGWSQSRTARRLLHQARRMRVRRIVGISSNRARAALLNARSRSLRGKAKALQTYIGVRFAQWLLTACADGTFIVGDGLRPLVSRRCRSLHVTIASWIRDGEFDTALRKLEQPESLSLNRLCIASRLERMKGVHVGVEAFARICREEQCDSRLQLTILGAGAERAELEEQVRDSGVSHRVTFGGTRSYPSEFLDELSQHGIVLLTNLGDEQPRLVFDAISQGCLPVCPDSDAYVSLGLPSEVLYRTGDVSSLADAIRRIRLHPAPRALLRDLVTAARRFTLDAMHRARAAWIEEEILPPDARSSPR